MVKFLTDSKNLCPEGYHPVIWTLQRHSRRFHCVHMTQVLHVLSLVYPMRKFPQLLSSSLGFEHRIGETSFCSPGKLIRKPSNLGTYQMMFLQNDGFLTRFLLSKILGGFPKKYIVFFSLPGL